MTIVRAITFEGKKTASKALDVIEETKDYMWLDEVAVISRSKHGFVRVDSTWAQDSSAVGIGTGWGALTGALIGALMGPQGAIAGALGAGALGGGTLGAFFGGLFNLSLYDPRLENFANQLKKDSSALILVSDEGYAGEFSNVFAPYGGTLIETEINEHDVNALREAIKAEAARTS